MDAVTSAEPLSSLRRLKLCLDVAKGMAFLAQRHVVHCDLKPQNVLLTSSGQAKLCDMGLARVSARINSENSSARRKGAGGQPQRGSLLSSCTKHNGTPAYCAPELQSSVSAASVESDV